MKTLKSSKPKLIPQRKTRSSKRDDFENVVRLIDAARTQAVVAVNTTMIDLYWSIGEFINRKIESAAWGMSVVDQLANHISRKHPGLRGFTRSNLMRMRQFYATYRDNQIVAALLRQLPWTHNLLILAKSKRAEEREFYLRTALNERWSSRELERQLNGALFERVVLAPTKMSPPMTQMHPDASSVFKDSYLIEFLNLPPGHSEDDLQRGLVDQLKHFLIELGHDFCFVGSQYPLQVGKRDFQIDLLFFNRTLNCLVVFELKVGEFEPEFLGKLQFYLEALDRDIKKPHEQPSIGVLLCATKNEEVVEYTLSRSHSPTLVAEYQTRLPDKKLLQSKLHEFYSLAESLAKGQISPRPRSALPKPKTRKRRSLSTTKRLA